MSDHLIKEIQDLRRERDEARKLARKMYQALIQFPTSVGDLVLGWPEEPPEWLWKAR